VLPTTAPWHCLDPTGVTLSRMVADEFIEISRLGQLRTKADNIRDIASGALKLTPMKRLASREYSASGR